MPMHERRQKGSILAAIAWLLLSHSAVVAAGPSFVVSQDGSGDFETLQDAIDAMKSFPPERITIHVRNGVYREKVKVHEWNTRLTILGEDPEKTRIAYDDYFDRIARGRNSTFFTPTMQVDADDFVAKNLTIENSAGDVGQAVALAVNANRAVFRNVRLLGNQDTLYVSGEGNRMLFYRCYIEGTTDFIFGSASAVFQECTIHSKKDSYITAASTPESSRFGLVFIRADLTADAGIGKVYLGRPWREFAQTAFIDSTLGAHIVAEGWHDWDNPRARETACYVEFGNHGAGAGTERRVAWSRVLSAEVARRYDPESLLRSDAHPGWYRR